MVCLPLLLSSQFEICLRLFLTRPALIRTTLSTLLVPSILVPSLSIVVLTFIPVSYRPVSYREVQFFETVPCCSLLDDFGHSSARHYVHGERVLHAVTATASTCYTP